MMELGKMLLAAGLILCAVGGLLWLAGHWHLPFGRLPGDIKIERPNFRFYFPIATCLLVSAVVTLIVWLLRRR
jgi:Protein of unknown function (DUF2905)